MEVDFAAGADGRRSSSSAGRAVVAAALRPVDPAGADAAAAARNWRSDYVGAFRRLVEAGLGDRADWLAIARAGLAATDEHLRWGEQPLTAALTAPAGRALGTQTVTGTGDPAGFALPYRGELLRGDGVRRAVDRWVAAGVAEPSLAEVIDAVLAHPEWLRLEGATVVALGAGAEMGPLPVLLGWGATVAAVDLPGAAWDRVRAAARSGAGTLLLPDGDGSPAGGSARPAADGAAPPAGGASGGAGPGVDLVREVPAVAEWVAGLPGRPVLGHYAYAPGGLHVRVSAAADVLGRRVRRDRPDTALAFLATPTDVFAVPGAAVAHAVAGYDARPAARRLLGAVSGHRLARPSYAPGADPGVNDSLVPTQGPNYALAKRIQRWRAAVAREDGATVSLHVAPSTRTRSVVSNRALKAAFDGAHHYGVEVFEPATSTVLLAALLVHDLHTAPVRRDHPWQDEAYAAVHGGLWRTPYAPRSVLGLAAARGALHV